MVDGEILSQINTTKNALHQTIMALKNNKPIPVEVVAIKAAKPTVAKVTPEVAPIIAETTPEKVVYEDNEGMEETTPEVVAEVVATKPKIDLTSPQISWVVKK